MQSSAYTFRYAWHVPAFVIVTGHRSRSFAWTQAKLIALRGCARARRAVPWALAGFGGVLVFTVMADSRIATE